MAITMSYPHLHAFELSIFGCLFIYSFYEGGGETGSHVNSARTSYGAGMTLNF